jgi:hypothetical protein
MSKFFERLIAEALAKNSEADVCEIPTKSKEYDKLYGEIVDRTTIKMFEKLIDNDMGSSSAS